MFQGRRLQFGQVQRIAQHGQEADFLARNIAVGNRHLNRQRVSGLRRSTAGRPAFIRASAVCRPVSSCQDFTTLLRHMGQAFGIKAGKRRQGLHQPADAGQFALPILASTAIIVIIT